MGPWIVPVVALGVPLLVGALALIVRRLEQQDFVAGFVDDDAHVATASFLRGVRLRHRDGPPNVLTARRAGKHHSVLLWDVIVDDVGLGARTGLQVSREGVLGALREAVGFRDIEVGDADFDRTFRIRGDDPDIVRGALANDDARAAISALFDETEVWSCRLDRRGRLHVVMRRERLDPQEARHRLACVRRLAMVLHEARDVEPLLPPVRGEVGAVSSSSGAPVGFGVR